MVVVCQILLFNCNDVCLWIILLVLKKITLQLFQALSTCRVRATSKALHLSFNYSRSLPGSDKLPWGQK